MAGGTDASDQELVSHSVCLRFALDNRGDRVPALAQSGRACIALDRGSRQLSVDQVSSRQPELNQCVGPGNLRDPATKKMDLTGLPVEFLTSRLQAFPNDLVGLQRHVVGWSQCATVRSTSTGSTPGLFGPSSSSSGFKLPRRARHGVQESSL